MAIFLFLTAFNFPLRAVSTDNSQALSSVSKERNSSKGSKDNDVLKFDKSLVNKQT